MAEVGEKEEGDILLLLLAAFASCNFVLLANVLL